MRDKKAFDMALFKIVAWYKLYLFKSDFILSLSSQVGRNQKALGNDLDHTTLELTSQN